MKKLIIISLLVLLCMALMATCFVGCNIVLKHNYKTTNHTVDAFEDINVDVDVAKVSIKKSADAQYGVVCYETEDIFHDVFVENNELNIRSTATNNTINLDFVLKTLSVTIYLSEDHYGNLKIHTDTGMVTIDSGLTFDSIDINTDTGAISCHADTNGLLDVNSDTGAISIENVTKASAINVDCSTGLISLNDVKCANLNIESDTGAINAKNVECTNASIDVDTGKVTLTNFKTDILVASTNTGDVALNNVEILGAITITSDTGNIHGSLRLADNVVSKIKTDTGNVSVQYID